MSDLVWFYLFLLATALFLGSSATLFMVLHPATDKSDLGSVQRQYSSPDYSRTAGFRITSYPESEILVPGRFWLIDNGTAEIEYIITPANPAVLRAAPAGTLVIPATFANNEYESVRQYKVDGVTVTQSQSPGRDGMLSWTKDGFDYALFAQTPEMNLLGGVSTDFVRQTNAVKT